MRGDTQNTHARETLGVIRVGDHTSSAGDTSRRPCPANTSTLAPLRRLSERDGDESGKRREICSGLHVWSTVQADAVHRQKTHA